MKSGRGTLKVLLGEYGDYVVEKRARDLLQNLHQRLLSLAHDSGTWKRNARGVSVPLLLTLLLVFLRKMMWSADNWDRDQNLLWR